MTKSNEQKLNKTVLLGITGGIAVYKVCELIRMYKKNGFNVKVIPTKNALEFVGELTLTTLSDNPVYKDNFEIKEYKPEHISLADEGDIMVIAPASANTISKIANGICDNLLTSVVCAFNKPIIIAPAMNTNMWNNSIIQENVKKLQNLGFEIVPPEDGFLACGTVGKGRLCKIEKIFDKTNEILNTKKTLSGKKFVITAGGTIEKIDPVRYISNFSSGKMGIALADNVYMMGGEVELISTVGIDRPYKVTKVQTADEMLESVLKTKDDADYIIMSAAVADYKAKNQASQKQKKTDADSITIELVKNPDILKTISKDKKEGQTIIGFCAESENLKENAKIKIKSKGCDFIVANDISKSEIGFSSDYNEVYIIDKSLNIKHLKKDTKFNIAKQILENVV